MDHNEFYELAMQPDFPNEMVFELENKDPTPDRSFSMEGFQEVSDQVKHFVMARSLARMSEGKPAKSVSIHIAVKWDTPVGDDQEFPWYHLNDAELTQMDGEHRVKRPR